MSGISRCQIKKDFWVKVKFLSGQLLLEIFLMIVLAAPILCTSLPALATSNMAQQTEQSGSLSNETECAVSKATRDAIEAAKKAEHHTPESQELIKQAEAAARYPECHSVRALLLAEEAKFLADKNAPEVRERKAKQLEEEKIRKVEIERAARGEKYFVYISVFALSLIILNAIYRSYKCLTTDDEQQKASASDNLVSSTVVLLLACFYVPVVWWNYRIHIGPRGWQDWLEAFAVLEGISLGLLFAGIPGVFARIALKGAKTRKRVANIVMRISISFFVLGVLSLIFGPIFTLSEWDF